MRLASIILASAISAGALATDASAVSKRPKLTGFGGIPFGITESELRDTLQIVKAEGYITDSEIAWFESASPVEVDGAPFLLHFVMERGILRRISTLSLAPAQNGKCKSEFDAMVAYLASQYGPPDGTSQRGKSEFYQAEFEFEDHAYIELLTTFNNKDACIDAVMYYSPAAVAQ